MSREAMFAKYAHQEMLETRCHGVHQMTVPNNIRELHVIMWQVGLECGISHKAFQVQFYKTMLGHEAGCETCQRPQ
ncbi:MAG TPA: hypothetical protein EYP98_08030, partial [Planctomycetes bacterium]|nr:hypothetical protein [Planctomycetota bacterium]